MDFAEITLPVRKPFGLFATAVSHGWYQTQPFRWSRERNILQRAERLMDGRVMLVDVLERRSSRRGYADLTMQIHGDGAGDPGVAPELARRLSVALRLDADLRPFYRLCRDEPALRDALRLGAGRCMRAPTLWEDIVKTILGTNVVWKQAVVMINRLAELGDVCPADPSLHAWPTPGQVARAGEAFLRDRVRAGYRSPYIVELVRRQKSGDLDIDALDARSRSMSADELFKALTSIKGIGKSSAHFLMNLLGRYGHISIDSATFAYAKRALFNGRQPTERQIRRRFERFGDWQSLAYWFGRWSAKFEWWEDASGRSSA